jgi:DNA replication licensing factor MCM3
MAGLPEPILGDDRLRDRSRKFQEFLDDTSKPTFNYTNEIDRMLRLDETRLIVNIDDLRDYASDSRELADGYAFLCLSFLSPFIAHTST